MTPMDPSVCPPAAAASRSPRLMHDELPKEHEDPLIRRLHLAPRHRRRHAEEMLAIAAVVLALGVTHWLVGK
ncbi:MAG: hypothetical protein ACQER5_03320 [Pseudomonadota bacterium]